MDPVTFEIQATDGLARSGVLSTPHGSMQTPAFFPVGTYGAVRGIAPNELRSVGVEGVLANTYHLHLRPGEELIRDLGGLQRFMGWDGPMLTDSGGYQLYSLNSLLERAETGVTFRSPIDGSQRELSPESAIAIQEALGADLICVLDEFAEISPMPTGAELEAARGHLERTLRWAERCRRAHTRDDQLLFGIVQGGGSAELRALSATETQALGFEAFAIGGLGVGDSKPQRGELLAAALEPLRPEAPRYLMGLGEPPDLVAAIAQGVDIFDCVVPTRNGRHGMAFTAQGRINLRNARFRDDSSGLEAGCPCPACTHHSRAYLNHLIRSGEALGSRLISLHNIAFYMRMLQQLRAAIREERFDTWREEWSATYASSGSATDSAA